MTRLLIAISLLLSLSGCQNSGYVPKDSDARDRDEDPQASTLRRPGKEELRSLRKLASVIVIGVVDERIDRDGQLSYRVRVREILSRRPGLASGDAYKVEAEKELKVDAFLFREERNSGKTEIGTLNELDRYLFFLAARPEKPGEWFNLDDAAGYPLPQAQETVEALRVLVKAEPLDVDETKKKDKNARGAGSPGVGK